MADISIFHDPACGTSRNMLALIRHAGFDGERCIPVAPL